MRTNRLIVSILIFLLPAISAAEYQRNSKKYASGTSLLARAVSAATRGAVIQDVVLVGTVRHVAGSTDENGRVELKTLATGETSAEMVLPSGNMREVHAYSGARPVGEWIGADGKHHAIAYNNLLPDPAWFSPSIILQKALAAPTEDLITSSEKIGSGSAAVEHLQILHRFQSNQTSPRLPQELIKTMEAESGIDLYFDPETLLPLNLSFQVHPENYVHQNIPVHVSYSDYRLINGIQVPFRIRKFVSNTLVFDIRLESANFNTGLTRNSFTVSDETLRSLPR